MKASLTLPRTPTVPFRVGWPSSIPLLDPKTRTTKVHLHFMNPKGELKPEMYGEVVLEGTAKEGLRIPADAVIRSGTQNVVFLARGQGRFEPRVVQIGSKSGDQVEVTGGLEEGQQVVTRANFLVDSESALRASLSAIGGSSRAQADHPLFGREQVPGHRRHAGRHRDRRTGPCANIPLDALPDLSDTQVIVYSRWESPADIIEDQVSYPIITALLGAPKVKAIRGYSDFGFSYVYVIFEDGTDIYWRAPAVLEYLSRSCRSFRRA